MSETGAQGTTGKNQSPRQGVKGFHVMAKAVGCACNLDCAYCYYLSKGQLTGGSGKGRMSDETLEDFIRNYISSISGPEVVFSWQGGEPTLLGLDFYRRVVALQAKYAKPGQRIENDLQTNGTLLTEEWAAFLKKHRFLVGLSIDGPRELHDRYRVTKAGAPTFTKVMAAARLLQKYEIPFNTLTCINRHNARQPLDVYRFLRNDLGSRRMQFIPIVEYKGFERTPPGYWDRSRFPPIGSDRAKPGHEGSIVTEWSVDPEDWGYFLCSIFDRWIKNDVGRVMVNHIETLISQHIGLGPQLCVYGKECGRGLAIESDGSVYSCDHYVYPEYRLGNAKRNHLDELLLSSPQVTFGQQKHTSLPRTCRECEFLADCWGECPKNRIIRTADGEEGLNYLCPGFRQFFKHALPRLRPVIRDVRLRLSRY